MFHGDDVREKAWISHFGTPAMSALNNRRKTNGATRNRVKPEVHVGCVGTPQLEKLVALATQLIANRRVPLANPTNPPGRE